VAKSEAENMNTTMQDKGGLDQAEVEVLGAGRKKARRNGKRRSLVEQVNQRVRQEFFARHSPNNPLHTRAYDKWSGLGKSKRASAKVGEVVLKITDPLVLKTVVEYCVQECVEILAILNRKAAGTQTAVKEKAVIAAIGERQGFFLEDEDVVDVRRLEVRRHNQAEEIEVYQQLVEFSHAIGTGKSETTAKELCEGKLPPELRMDGMVEFAKDLGEFLLTSGEDGLRLVARICEDEGFARNVTARDHDAPRPIKFLAEISLKVANATRRSKVQERKIGFGQ